MNTLLQRPPTPTGRADILRRAAAVSLVLENAEDHWWSAQFFALGSPCELFFQCDEPAAARDFTNTALRWLAEFEASYSRFTPDSLISRVNARAGSGEWTAVDTTFQALADVCQHAHNLSGGAFDATSLPLSRLWNWKTQPEQLPSTEEIERALSLVGWDKVERETGKIRLPLAGMALDFGGVGKEFAVDALVFVLENQGIQHGMVDLGRDIRVLGKPPEGGDGWTVGLEAPELTDGDAECHGRVLLRSGVAIATSGDYRRSFVHEGVRYGHIINCKTGWPVAHGTTSASVVAKTCVTAGCTATAAMAMGGQRAMEMINRLPHVEGMLWDAGHKRLSRQFRLLELPERWND